MDELRKMLEDEIASEIKNLAKLKPGTDDHSIAVDSVVKLYRLKMDEDKDQKELELHEAEVKEAAKQNEIDNKFKKIQADNSKIDIIARVGSIVVVATVEMIAYGHWFNKGLKFEETGALTSQTLRGVMGKFNPFKK